MIVPLLKDEAFLADVRRSAEQKDALRLWWLGQSGFLLQWNGRHALLDPYLSDSLTKKYASTDKPHVRMTERVIAPERLDFIDVVSSSHNHTDHLDAETLLPLRQANPRLQMVIAEANRAFIAERLHCEPGWPLGLNIGRRVTIAGFEFTAVPAAHEALEPAYVGYIVRVGKRAIYHSGDTILYDGMADRLRPFAPDMALLPINGAAPERRVAGNLNGREAAQLAKNIGARLAIPMHYEMFAFNTATTDEFVAEAKRLGQGYHILRAGEGWSSTAP